VPDRHSCYPNAASTQESGNIDLANTTRAANVAKSRNMPDEDWKRRPWDIPSY
jgi:hypothetical protein